MASGAGSERSGPVQGGLGRSAPVWTVLDRPGTFEPVRAALDQFRTGWAVQAVWAGPNRTGLVRLGPDQAGELTGPAGLGLSGRPGLVRAVRTGSGWLGPVLDGPGEQGEPGGRFPLSRLSGNRPFTSSAARVSLQG